MSIRFACRLVPLLACALRATDAQVMTATTSTTLFTATLRPIDAVTFTPYALASSLGGSPLAVGLSSVSVTSADRVILRRVALSGITVSTPQGIANGTYSVRFTIARATEPLTLTVTAGGTTTQCTLQVQLLYASTAPTQTCDTGQFAVANQQLLASIQVAWISPNQAGELDVTSITVNRWK